MSSSHGFVYLLGCDIPGDRYAYKIGRSKNLIRRLDQYAKLPVQIKVLCYYETPDMFSEERLWHRKYFQKRLRGEWFELDSHSITEFSVTALRAYKDRMSFREWWSHYISICYIPPCRDKFIWTPDKIRWD